MSVLKAVAAVLAAAALAAAWPLFIGSPGETATVEVDVANGLSAVQTGELLESSGVVGSARLFLAAAKFSGFDRKLRPGFYTFKRGSPVLSVLRALTLGGANEVKVSIPEGFSVRQIAERLEANGLGTSAEVMGMAAELRLEGYLFPSTYHFERGGGAAAAVRRMQQEFKRQVEPEYEKAQGKPPLTLHQIVTLASIVEREAVLSEEKPTIAAVYLNRMRRRMRLEADPTVQYALGHWKKGINYRDLKVDSPYNTYAHFGLPPGPICSPGLASIRAALAPAQTDALYFVADAKGGHTFSNTIEEHNKAKARFKREVRAQKAKLAQPQR